MYTDNYDSSSSIESPSFSPLTTSLSSSCSEVISHLMMFYKMVSVILWPMLQVNAFLFLCTIVVVDPTNPNDKEDLEWFGFKLVGDNIDKNVKPRNIRFSNQTTSLHYFHVYNNTTHTCECISPNVGKENYFAQYGSAVYMEDMSCPLLNTSSAALSVKTINSKHSCVYIANPTNLSTCLSPTSFLYHLGNSSDCTISTSATSLSVKMDAKFVVIPGKDLIMNLLIPEQGNL